MLKMTHEELYASFCNENPEMAEQIEEYKPWGSTSIIVHLKDGKNYKVKCCAPDRFTVQVLTLDDIRRKFNK